MLKPDFNKIKEELLSITDGNDINIIKYIDNMINKIKKTYYYDDSYANKKFKAVMEFFILKHKKYICVNYYNEHIDCLGITNKRYSYCDLCKYYYGFHNYNNNKQYIHKLTPVQKCNNNEIKEYKEEPLFVSNNDEYCSELEYISL